MQYFKGLELVEGSLDINALNKRNPYMDGLRGLAILMVMIAHFNHEQLLKEYYPSIGPVITKIALMGLTGVDLFFVLSGFLITGIILKYAKSQNFLLSFYVRRFLRIFPLYYLVLFFLFVVLPCFVSFDVSTKEVGRQQVYLWTYLSNLPLGQLNWDSEMFGLGHFWSLAVEEHFYLVWPAIIIIFRHHLKKICFIWAITSFAAGIVVAILLGDGYQVPLLSWSTIHHSGGLALGGLCAIYYREGYFVDRIAVLKKMTVVCLLFFIALSLVPRVIIPRLEIFIYPFASLFYAGLLIVGLYSTSGNIINRIIGHKYLQGIGIISYGLYVYHGVLWQSYEKIFPVAAFIDHLKLPFLGLLAFPLLSMSATVVVAFISWHLYEKRVLKLKKYFNY
jgi:peptidoglycan/LPS O-acetylase OafA/YrhL